MDMKHKTLIDHSVDPVVEGGHVDPLGHGPNKTFSLSRDRLKPRHRVVLRIQRTPRCHGDPTVEKPQNSI